MPFFASPSPPSVIEARLRIQKIRAELQSMDARQVRLIAVSKTHSPKRIQEFLLAGQTDFGENRQNEAREKFPLVQTKDLPNLPKPIYHHIGPLQSGSARQIPGLFAYVHGVSSWRALDALLKAVERYQDKKDPHYVLRYLFQVKLTDETSKVGGFSPDELSRQQEFPMARGCYPVGFMTMGPSDRDIEKTRRVFRELRKIRDSLLPNGELSMGMSGDWRVAVEEGSTMIRLGTCLFGPRKDGPWRP